MALRDFLFGFKFLATDYVSPVLKNIENRMEAINSQVKNTARWREAAVNIGIMGGAAVAAGGAVGYALKSALDSAGAMQTEMTHVATAMNDGAATARNLAQAQAMAEKTSIASGIAAISEGQAYYIARSNMLDHAQALAAVNIATKLTVGTTASLADAQSQLEPTTRLLTSIYQNFGSKLGDPTKQMSAFADTLAKLQTQYAFRDIGELNEALSYSTALAKSAGIGFNDMNAALAVLSLSQKHGAEAGTAFAEMVQKLSTDSKLRGMIARTAAGGIDLGKTLDRLRAQTAGLDDIHKAMYLHQIGFTERSIVGVSLILDKMGLYHSAVNDLNNAQGANAAAFLARQASMEIATGRLAAAWDVFKSKIGEQLIGPVTYFTNELSKALTWITGLVDRHPQIAKFAVTFAAVGAAIAVVAGGAALVVAGLLAAASYASATVIAFTAVATAIAGVTAWLYVWHSAALKTIINFASEAFSAGAHIVTAIASGIWSAAALPGRAIAGVLHAIRDHLPFSPARTGPLRDLNRVRIVETIAQTIRPAPAIAAIRRTAAAVAIAAPVILSPMMPTSALAAAPGRAQGGAAVVLNYSPTINMPAGSDAKDLLAVLRQHSRELKEIVEGRKAHEDRREF